MANAITYVKNVAKSVGYSTIDVVKDMNPALTSFKETNSDVIKSAYGSIKNLKHTSKKITAKVMENDYAEVAQDLIKNIKSDIKSGKLYNLERQDKLEQKAADSIMDISEFDFGFMDDNEDPFADSGDEEFSSSSKSSDSGNNMVDLVGKKSTEAMASIMANTAQYTVTASHADNKALYDQNKMIYISMHSGMKTLNENLSHLVEFASSPLQSHLENSTKFYETENGLSQERNKILEEIKDLYKQQIAPEKTKSRSDRIIMNDILDSEGMVDLANYGKKIKQNIKDMSSGFVDMAESMFTKENLKVMTASPLKFISDIFVKSLLPNTLKDTVKDFNKSLSGAFASSILKLNNADDFGIMGIMKNIFGVKAQTKDSLNTSKYEKGPVPFDGITKKSIVEVIPTYLSQIVKALSGQDKRYNYEEGKFESMDQIKGSMDSKFKSARSMANMDIEKYLYQYKKKIKFNNKEEESQFDRDLEAILNKSFKDGKLFNYRNPGSASSYGLKGGKASEINFEIIKQMFAKMPKNVQLQWANSYFSAKDMLARSLEDSESGGYDVLMNLYNGSDMISGPMSVNNNQTMSRKEKKVAAAAARKKNKNNQKTAKSNNKDKSDYTDWSDKDALNYQDLFNGDAGDIIKDKLDSVNNKDIGSSDSLFNFSLSDKADEEEKGLKKIKKVYRSWNDLLHKPADLIAGMVKKADTAIYDLIFGRENRKDEDFDKGIGRVIIDELKKSFVKFGDWVDKKIIDPLNAKLNTSFKSLGQKFAKLFGLNPEDIIGDAKDKVFGAKDENGKRSGGLIGGNVRRAGSEIKNAGKFVKNTVTDAADAVELTSKLNEAGKVKKDKNSKIDDLINDLGVGSIDNAADGIKKVAKTGVVAVSEGEMILPPDLNPLNIEKREKNENKEKGKFLGVFKNLFSSDDIDSYAKGGNVKAKTKIANGLLNGDIDKEKFDKLDPKLKKKVLDELESMKSEFDSSDYVEGREQGLIGKSLDKIKEGATQVYEEIKSYTTDKDGKEVDSKKEKDNVIKKILSETKSYFPEMIGGGLIGTGISMITGIVGGPLVGAALGAGVSLFKHSEKVQEALFGEKDENGQRKGNLVSANISNALEKYVPSMAKGGTLGIITSLIPFTPFGPVGGIILGSAAGFASKNEKVHEKLFGEGGLLGKDFDKKVKKALPNIGAGTLAGLVVGPFGPVTNILLGSAIGFATSTDKFKNLIFGDEEKGKEGLLKKAYDNTLKPITDHIKGQLSEAKLYIKKKFKEPIEKAMVPIKKQFQLIGKGITGFLKKKVDSFAEKHLGAPLDKFLKDKILGPLTKVFKSFTKGLFKLALSPLKLVGSAFGAVGNSLTARQIRKGNADYLSAEQRNLFRETEGNKRFFKNLTPQAQRNAQYDKFLQGTTVDQAQDLSSRIDKFREEEESIKSAKNSAYDQYNKDVRHNTNLSAKETSKLGRAVKKEIAKEKDPERAKQKVLALIASNPNLNETEREKIKNASYNYIATAIEKNHRLSDLQDEKQKFVDTLRNSDENLKDFSVKDLDKFSENLKTEAKFKSAKEKAENEGKEDDKANKAISELPDLNEAQSIRHKETVNRLDMIIDVIGGLKNPNTESINDLRDKYNQVWDEQSHSYIQKAKEKKEEENQNQQQKQQRKEDKAAKKDQENRRNDYTNATGVMEARAEEDVSVTPSPMMSKLQDKAESVIMNILDKLYENPAIANAIHNAVEKNNPVPAMATAGGATADGLDDGKNNIITQTDAFGNVIEYRRSKEGGLEPNTADTDTKFAFNLQDKLKNAIFSIPVIGTGISKLTGVVGFMKDGLFGNKKKNKKGLLSTLLGGILGEGGLLGGLLSFFTGKALMVKGLAKTVVNKFLPKVATMVGLPALLYMGFDGAFDKLGELVGNLHIFRGEDTKSGFSGTSMVAKDANGKLTMVGVDDQGNYMTDGNGHYVSQDGTTLYDAKTAGTNNSISGDLARNTVTKTVLGKPSILTKGLTKSMNAAKDIGAGAAKGLGKNGLDITSKIANALSKLPNILSKIPFMGKIAENSKKLIDLFSEKIGKKLGNKAAKFAAGLTTALPVIRVAYVVGAGVNAWGNAESILGITDDATFGQKCIATLVAVINAMIPFIGDFIPNDVLVNIFMEIAPKIGIDVSELQSQREKAKSDVETYNKDNGTNLSVKEYNEMVMGRGGIITKAKNKISQVKENIKNGTFKQGVIDKANAFKESVNDKGLGETVADTIDSIIPGPIGDLTSSAVRLKTLALKGDVDGIIKLPIISTKEGEEENLIVKIANVCLGTVMKIPNIPIAMISKGIHFAIDTFSNIKDWFGTKIKNTSSNFKTIKSANETMKELAKDGDVEGVWKTKISLKDNDLLKPLFSITSGLQKLFYVAGAAFTNFFGPIMEIADNIKDKVTGVFSKFKKWLKGEDNNNDEEKSVKKNKSKSKKKKKRSAKGSDLDLNNSNSSSKDGTFISQIDPKYANKGFNISGDTSKQTLGDTGCGPAAAAMVINNVTKQNQLTMDQASKEALKYKVQNSGVSADYFADEFSKNGLISEYITDNDPTSRSQNIATHLRNGHQVVLMGQDASNTSKANSPFGPNAHYVVANKMSDDGRFIYVNDPEANKPNIRYNTSSILNSTKMGIAGYAASGSDMIMTMRNNIRRYTGRGINLVGSNTNEQTFNFLIDSGFTPEAAAAAVGNLCVEAGVDKDGNMVVNSTEKGGSGVGIIQWSKGRRTNFINFAAQNGDPWPGTSLATQLAFMSTELQGGGCWAWVDSSKNSDYTYDPNYHISFEEFKACNNVEIATGAWCANYERPYTRNAHLDRRVDKAVEVYNLYSGKHMATPGNISGTSSSDGSSNNDTISSITDTFNVFDDLAKAYGLTLGNSDSTSSDSSTNTSSTTTSGGSEQQNALVDKMKSVEGKLQYSQSGPRNPDKGSADCSSTVGWAYKNILNVDPGNTTRDMAVDSDLYTVTESLDPAQFQPGDILLYKNDKGIIGHVEMYAGNNKIIGHGGGMGPKIKEDVTKYKPNQFAMARRWVGFQNQAASGTGIAQTDEVSIKPIVKPDFLTNSSDKNKYKPIQLPASYVAAGSGLAKYQKGVQMNNQPKFNIFDELTRTSSNNTDNNEQFTKMINLLSAISSNTANISAIVEILKTIAELEAKQSEIDTSTEEGKRKSQEISSKRDALIASLKTIDTSDGDDGSLAELLQNVDVISKM